MMMMNDCDCSGEQKQSPQSAHSSSNSSGATHSHEDESDDGNDNEAACHHSDNSSEDTEEAAASSSSSETEEEDNDNSQQQQHGRVIGCRVDVDRLYSEDGQALSRTNVIRDIVKVCTQSQSNPLKWIALGPDYDYPLRWSIHLSMFYTLQ